MFIKEIFDGKNPEDLDEETLTTINKFFENSLNVSETSRQLFIHRNTLVYRSSEYVQATRHFVELDNTRIQENMKDLKRQLRFVYVGRETCPYCREFAPKLKEAAKSINATIYYIDTENKTDELAKFAEQYHIDSIPTLLVFRNGEIIDKSIGLIQKHEVKALFAK